MKTIPPSNYKIQINNDFINIAKHEIYNFYKQGFFAKRKYDFKNLPILNYLDKSLFKYITQLEQEIDKLHYGSGGLTMAHPEYNIQDDKDYYYYVMTHNIIENLIKDKQFSLVINNIELCNNTSIHAMFIEQQYDKSLLIKRLHTLDKNDPHILSLLNLFDPTFKYYK